MLCCQFDSTQHQLLDTWTAWSIVALNAITRKQRLAARSTFELRWCRSYACLTVAETVLPPLQSMHALQGVTRQFELLTCTVMGQSLTMYIYAAACTTRLVMHQLYTCKLNASLLSQMPFGCPHQNKTIVCDVSRPWKPNWVMLGWTQIDYQFQPDNRHILNSIKAMKWHRGQYNMSMWCWTQLMDQTNLPLGQCTVLSNSDGHQALYLDNVLLGPASRTLLDASKQACHQLSIQHDDMYPD